MFLLDDPEAQEVKNKAEHEENAAHGEEVELALPDVLLIVISLELPVIIGPVAQHIHHVHYNRHGCEDPWTYVNARREEEAQRSSYDAKKPRN